MRINVHLTFVVLLCHLSLVRMDTIGDYNFLGSSSLEERNCCRLGHFLIYYFLKLKENITDQLELIYCFPC